MPKRLVDVRSGPALFNIVSYGRGGPGRSSGLSIGQIELISRTVSRTPEVMVKVLPKDSNNAQIDPKTHRLHWPAGRIGSRN